LANFVQQFPDKLAELDQQKTAVVNHEEQAKVRYYEAHRKEETRTIAAETGKGFAKLRVETDRKRIDNHKKREYIDLQEQLSGLPECQLKIVSIMDEKSKHIDDIIELKALSAPEVLSELTILQIKGFVSQENGKRFTLNIAKR